MMLSILNVIRWRSILFVVFLLYMVRYFVVQSILDINGFQLQMDSLSFGLLVTAICCIMIAAYVINDYFDTRADRVSGVRPVIVGRLITRRCAITLHTLFNILAMGIVLYLSLKVGIWKIAVLFFIVTGILWFYSSNYKRYFITGNVLVAFLTALLPFTVVVFEIPLLNIAYSELLLATHTDFTYILNWILGFSYFIFLHTLMYEINKDMYTIEGDLENAVNSIPIKWGIPCTRYLLIGLVVWSIVSLFALYITVFREDICVLVYMVVALLVPYILYIFSLLRKEGNRKLQLFLIQLIMLCSIAFGFVLKHFFGLIFNVE